MNYYNKLQKYIEKVNYIGGAAAASPKRLYEFKEGGFQQLEIDINELIVPDLPAEINPKFNFKGIHYYNRLEAEKMIRILKLDGFIPRFNELWSEIYDMILHQGYEYYTINYPYNVNDNTDYGLIILKSIYDYFKYRRNAKGQLVKVFADNDDICERGYSPHIHRLCRSFSGIYATDLLHWPDMSRICDNDNAPRSANNDKPGCRRHRNEKSCCHYHKNTPLDPKLCQAEFKRDVCHQSDFVISEGPVVVLFKGFQTLPNNGKWFKDLTPLDTINTCDFAINDRVTILDQGIRSTIGNVPSKIVVEYIIRELNYNSATNKCVSAKIKYKFQLENEYRDHPDKIKISDLTIYIPPPPEDIPPPRVDERTPEEIAEADADRTIKRYISELKRAKDSFVYEKDKLSISTELNMFIKRYPLPTDSSFIQLKELIPTIETREKELNEELDIINKKITKLESFYKDASSKRDLLVRLNNNTKPDGTIIITISDDINTLINERIPSLKKDRIAQGSKIIALQKSIKESYGQTTGRI